eukprot:TRINITY_DN4476_c0_g1_i1.p1 TRINITY_DN4476_c0_g1~~TRINITY_DN4476_c0_g1_i1.p1  ORF type:complete len:164 (+),score=14.64 TRINITY_DN4476_c0_g1_i1:88-579(+)
MARTKLTARRAGVDYYRVWIDVKGEIRVTQERLTQFEKRVHSLVQTTIYPVYVRKFIGEISSPEEITFVHLLPGDDSKWQLNNFSQWVVSVKGSWHISTTDETKIELAPGELVFFEDCRDVVQNGILSRYQVGVAGSELATLMIAICRKQIRTQVSPTTKTKL